MSIEQEYTPNISSAEYFSVVRNEGAVLLRGYVPETEQVEVSDAVLAEELRPVDRSGHTVPEQFHDTGWDFDDAPPAVKFLGERICNLVKPELPYWYVNGIRAQLYSPGEVGIEWHRDYKRDIGVVAVASFLGNAQFDIELRSGLTSWILEPGDLVLMRGALLNGTQDDRPRHRVLAPPTGQRLSVAYRQVVDEVPSLEPMNE